MAKQLETQTTSVVGQFQADSTGAIASAESMLRHVIDLQIPPSATPEELIEIRTSLGLPDVPFGPCTRDVGARTASSTFRVAQLVESAKTCLEALASATERRLQQIALEGRDNL